MINNSQKQNARYSQRGFTLIEIIIVVIILGIASLMAIPMVSNAADVQVRAAANRIAADLDYAKGLAITHQRAYSIVFDTSAESYDIRLTSSDSLIDHPVNPGNFEVDFSTTGSLDKVDIVSADFDSDTSKAITFDYLGSPYHGKSTNSGDALNNGTITLQGDNFTLYVKVEPVTGYLTIEDTP